jgi:hypothetical protein
MSFLNQLRNQAKELQNERTVTDLHVEQKAVETECACRVALPYLQDVARHLNVINPPTPTFTLDGKTPWPAMKMTDFRVDARRKMLRNREAFDYIAMGWQVVPQVGAPVGGVVGVNFPIEQQRVEARLAAGGVKHERKEIRHPEKNTLQELRFEYITQTRGSLMVTADHEKGQLHFRLVNTAGFDVSEISWPAAHVTNEVMDELAKRIVGQPNRFV